MEKKYIEKKQMMQPNVLYRYFCYNVNSDISRTRASGLVSVGQQIN